MKRKLNKRFALLTALLLLFVQTTSFAAAVKPAPTKYDPLTMTLEERAQWVVDNLTPVYVGTAQPGLTRSEVLYTDTNTSYVGPNNMYDVGKLQTQVKFTLDSTYTEVATWSTSVFRATALVSPCAVDSSSSSNRIAPDNVRIVYESWFGATEGAYFIEHWYNIYGNGGYAIYVNSGGPY